MQMMMRCERQQDNLFSDFLGTVRHLQCVYMCQIYRGKEKKNRSSSPGASPAEAELQAALSRITG